jgi:hypothetical protein
MHDDRSACSGSADTLARIYGEEPTAPLLERLDCDPEAVARELSLAKAMTARELERIRRDFALANHPDRVVAAQRDLATRRMSLANMLIDQALQEKKASI